MISFEDTENQLVIYVREFDAKNQNLITKYIKELVDKQKNGDIQDVWISELLVSIIESEVKIRGKGHFYE